MKISLKKIPGKPARQELSGDIFFVILIYRSDLCVPASNKTEQMFAFSAKIGYHEKYPSRRDWSGQMW